MYLKTSIFQLEYAIFLLQMPNFVLQIEDCLLEVTNLRLVHRSDDRRLWSGFRCPHWSCLFYLLSDRLRCHRDRSSLKVSQKSSIRNQRELEMALRDVRRSCVQEVVCDDGLRSSATGGSGLSSCLRSESW